MRFDDCIDVPVHTVITEAVIRRAIRHGHKLGIRKAFFHKLVAPLVDEMGKAYPELAGKGDGACNVEAEIATANPATTRRSVCVVAQQRGDTRFYQASGPFELGPGQSGTIVVAYFAAPTVETMPDGAPSGIVPDPANANRNPPGFPSFHPGFASARGCDINGTNCSVSRSATAHV